MADRQPRSKRTSVNALRLALRYHAVMLGTGEILEIVESIGRRQLRSIDPAGPEGRRLLAGGRVHLWGDPLTRGERVPVSELFGRMREKVERDEQRYMEDDRWRDSCAQRREILDRWETKYSGAGSIDH